MMSNYKYSESEFEESVLFLFEEAGYEYSCGCDIHRTNEDIILMDDFNKYIHSRYSEHNITDEEIVDIINNLTLQSGTTLYERMENAINTLRQGYHLDRSKLNKKDVDIDYFDFGANNNNIYRVVNQFEVKGSRVRRPDIVVFINGIPVSVIELKNLSDEKVKIYDAYEQLHIRYVRDIPNLMRYSFISVISDGVNTKFGSIFSKYKYYFPWKSLDGVKVSEDGINSLLTLVAGLFDKNNIINIINNYIYFPDTSKKDLMILPKYSQYYATEALYNNIKNHLKPQGDGKGGTYFGATGCGKSYTMLFLSRRLTRCPSLNNPTIVLLTDRSDLDDQLSEIFEASKQYLIDENTLNISNRKALNDNLRNISSGGIYLLTVQKFREDIGLLSDRTNIICISDEAHRTQVNLDLTVEVTDDEVKAHRSFATYLRASFPNATYIGFTGTPIDATINVFGPVVMTYTMKQSEADGSTVGIDLLPGPSDVRLDESKMAIVDKFYDKQLEEGANKNEVNQSIREMASVRTILDDDQLIDKVVKHFINHYETRVEEKATVKGKAMLVCYDRKIAYKFYKKIKKYREDWFVERKTQEDESNLTYEQIHELKPVEMVKLVATRNDNDEKELYDLLGDKKYRSELADLFKNENSNFKIAIVVDMWLTGFDCESLDTMYLDKPLERHNLIQTISRVNRIFEGKEKGLIVDYIGIEASLARAMLLYGNDINPVSDIEKSYDIFINTLRLIDNLMYEFDVKRFESSNPIERLKCLNEGIEYVQKTKKLETDFMGLVLRMRKAFDLCVGDERITEEELYRVHFYIAIRSGIIKMTKEDTPDAERMNEEVRKLVRDCIAVQAQVEEKEVTKIEIFSDEYLEKIKQIPYKNTRLKMLLELMKKVIREYSKTNKLKAEEFSKRMKKVVEAYNDRDAKIDYTNEEVINSVIDSLFEKGQQILEDLKRDAKEFENLGITFEEKAFFDILKDTSEKFGFSDKFTEEQFKTLAKGVGEIINDKSKYTDWLNKKNIRDQLAMDVKVFLNKNGYPPEYINNVYDQVIEQVDNYKRNEL